MEQRAGGVGSEPWLAGAHLPSTSRRSREADGSRVFEDFFNDVAPDLFSRLCVMTGDPTEAEAIMDSAFLKLWGRWDRYDERSTTALYFEASRVFMRRHRRAVRAIRRILRSRSHRAPFQGAGFTDEDRRVLLEMTARQRAALVLGDVIGYPTDEGGHP